MLSGPRDLKYLPTVVDGMDLAVIGIHAGFLIADDGARFPRLQKLVDDPDPLVGDLVALIVLMMALEAEVLRRPVVVCRHEIEAEAAPGQVV